MRTKVFIDTNFLIYLFSSSEPDKRDQCKKIFKYYHQKMALVWSTQVLQEFSHVLIKKHKVNPLEVKGLISEFHMIELILNDKETIFRSFEIQVQHRFSFWDSLIIAAAEKAECNILLSEDMSHGEELCGLQILNPFKVEIPE